MEKYSCTIKMVRIQNNRSLLKLVCKSNHSSHEQQKSSSIPSDFILQITASCYRLHQVWTYGEEKDRVRIWWDTRASGSALVDMLWVTGESLDAVHGLELAQSLHRVDVLLLGGSLHSVGLAIILLLSLH